MVNFLKKVRRWDDYSDAYVQVYLRGALADWMAGTSDFPSRCSPVIDERDRIFFERMQPFLENGGAAVFLGAPHPGVSTGCWNRTVTWLPSLARTTNDHRRGRRFHPRARLLPEHIIPYGTAASGLEPFLIDGYLYFFQEGKNLVFIGYPLGRPPEPEKMEGALPEVILSRRPEQVALLAPAVPPAYGRPSGQDQYFSLTIADLKIPPKVANMIRRASKGLKITRQRTVGPEHVGLIRNFHEPRAMDQDTLAIFQRIPAYPEASR